MKAIVLDTETTGSTGAGDHRRDRLRRLINHPTGRHFHAYLNPEREWRTTPSVSLASATSS
jgi:hypothetical protein